MPKLTYDEFIEMVNEWGFSTPYDGLGYADGQSFSGDPDTDPWIWKDRVTQEKKLAYGAFFNGKKGYIGPRFYSIFIDAFRPRKTVEERYESGNLGQYKWKFWNLLTSEDRALGTHEYRALIGVTAKDGRSALDNAVVKLQMTFDVTAVGNADMLDKNGKPYNQSVAYDKVDKWVPQEWLNMNPRMEHEEALEAIYRQVEKNTNAVTAEEAKEAFKKSLKLYKSFL